MSTPTPGQSQQLESLVTSIFMNADQFNTESGKVLATIDAIKEKFALMGAMITRAASSISHGISTANQGLQSTLQELTSKSNFGQIGQGVDGLTKSLKSLQTGLDKLNKNSSVVTTFTQNLSGFTAELNKLVGVATGITTLQTNLENFVKALGTMAAQLPKGASDFTRSLGQIGKFLDGVNNLNFDNLHQLPVAMNSFFRRMRKVLGGVDLSTLQIATSALSRMGTFMNALSKFKYTSVQAKSLAQMQGALSRLFDTMSYVGGLKDIDKAGVAMGHMSSMMRVMGQSSPKRIGSLVQPLDSLLNVFSKVPPDQIANTAKSFGALSRAMRNMAGAIPSNLVASAQATARAISILNSINVGKNAVQAANVISKIGAAMKNVGAGGPPGAGGKAGGWMSSFFNSIQGVSGAASAASGNVARLGYDFMALERNADSAGASLLSLRYGLLGLGAVGLFQFAQLDDALMRLSVHSRDFNQSNRAFITQGIFSLSGKSTSSAKEMALALDNLMSSGLSASMAMKVLATAEDYAVASGMKLSESAKGLNDLMHSMNLVPYEEGADGVEKYLANYQKLADLIVGVAPQVGSTEKEMMGAFTSRFMTASRLANMSIEESITVLGLMSRAGEAYRGQKGGNIAARGIEILALRSVPNRQMWLHMLGSEAQDAAGEVKPLFELLELMQKKMAATGTEKFIAEMMKLGIKDTESFNAVEPLLRTVAGAKDLRREMEFMKDAAKKAADAIRMSLKSQMMILWNTAWNTASVVGSHLAPALYLITKPITDMLYSFTMLNPAIQNFVVVIMSALVAMGPLRSSLLWFGTGIIKLVVSPITMSIQTISAMGAVLGWLGGKIYQIGKGFLIVGEFILNTSIKIYTGLVSIVTGIMQLPAYFYKLGKSIYDFGKLAINSVVAVAKSFWGALTTIWKTAQYIKNAVFGVFHGITSFLIGAYITVEKGIKGLVASGHLLYSIIYGVFTGLVTILITPFLLAMTVASAAIYGVGAAIAEIYKVGKLAFDTLTNLAANFIKTLSNVVTAIGAVLTSVASGLSTIVFGLVPMIVAAVGAVVVAILLIPPAIMVIGAVASAVGGLVIGLFAAIGLTISQLATALMGAASFAWTKFKSSAENAVLATSDAVKTLYGYLSDVGYLLFGGKLTKGWNEFKRAASDATKPIQSLVGFVENAGIGMATALSKAIGKDKADDMIKPVIAVWNDFKNNITTSTQQINSVVQSIGDGLVKTFDAPHARMRTFFKSLQSGFIYTAGLFWNFKHNMTVFFDWVGKYGVEPFEKIAVAATNSIFVIGESLWKFGEAVVTSLKSVFNGLLQSIRIVFVELRFWLQANWRNITSDISNVFSTMAGNFLQNWMVLSKAIGQVIYNNIVLGAFSALLDLNKEVPGLGTLLGITAAPTLLRGVKTDEDIQKTMKEGTVGIFDKMPAMKTDFATAQSSAEFAGRRLSTQWKFVGEDIYRGFAQAYAESNPIFKAFSELGKLPMFQELLQGFKVDLPDSKTAADFFKKATGLAGGEGTGPSLETRGREFSLKQSSAARFEFGGQELYRIQYQQLVTLQAINSTLQTGFAQRGIPAANPHAIPIRTMPTAEPILRP